MGHVSAFCCMIESNGHSGLHAHMTIFKKGAYQNPQDLLDRMSADEQYRQNILAYFDYLIKQDVEYGPEIEPHDPKNQTHPSSNR